MTPEIKLVPVREANFVSSTCAVADHLSVSVSSHQPVSATIAGRFRCIVDEMRDGVQGGSRDRYRTLLGDCQPHHRGYRLSAGSYRVSRMLSDTRANPECFIHYQILHRRVPAREGLDIMHQVQAYAGKHTKVERSLFRRILAGPNPEVDKCLQLPVVPILRTPQP